MRRITMFVLAGAITAAAQGAKGQSAAPAQASQDPQASPAPEAAPLAPALPPPPALPPTAQAPTAQAPAAAVSPPPSAYPNSGCTPESSQPVRRRPGTPVPDRLQAAACDPTRMMTPAPETLPEPEAVDRWKVIESVGVPDNHVDPYHGNNPIKGDRPLFGQDYINVTGTANTLVEERLVPAVAAEKPAVGLVGRRQLFESETITLDMVGYQGDTIFRPPDYQIRFTPILNYANTITNGVQQPTTATTVGATALFFEKHLWDVSANYDFDSIRLGIQGMISDFRGFVLSDQPVGVRLFGTRDNDIYQYSIGWFRTLPKNVNRQNMLGAGIPANDIVMGNLIIQDLGVLGLNSEFTAIYDRNRLTGTQIQSPLAQGEVAPATFVNNVRHDFDVGYFGYSLDGHIGRWNLTSSVYELAGEEKETLFGGRNSMVQANFAAFELSRDIDWMRFRLSGLYATGDAHPFSNQSRAFDGLSESALFAGADSTFFLHQQLKLISGELDLKERDSLYTDLHGSAQPGEPNFKNPGLRLAGLGTDLDLAPQLRVSIDANHMWFDQTQTLGAVLGTPNIPRDIGTEVALDVLYRPFDSQNIILRLSGAQLMASPGARALTGGSTPFSAFANLILTY